MRIAVIGMGNVGSVLGRRRAEAGHEATLCVRDPDNPQKGAEAEKVRAWHRGLGRDIALDGVRRPGT
jgi:3-hydroxyisobutyrate dehydrogenase-like beta-hydroxyacid dehydrogenase